MINSQQSAEPGHADDAPKKAAKQSVTEHRLKKTTLPALASRVVRNDAAGVLLATVAVLAIVGGFHSDFLAWGQLKDVLRGTEYVALLAMGMAFLLCMREIDLSVGATFALSLISTALLCHTVNPWLAAVLGILVGAGLGLVNALLVMVVRIPTIIATLATLSMFRGLALAMSKGQQVTDLPLKSSFFSIVGGEVLGLPFGVWVMIVVALLLTVVMRMTTFGYRIRAVGSNPDAAEFSGISIPRVRFMALVLIGALGGLAGVLALAFFQSGDPNIGSGFELQAIAGAIIGGTPLRGGRATIVGAAIGAILLNVVTSGLVYFNIAYNWNSFTTGVAILVAVAITSTLQYRYRRQGSAT